MTIRNTWMTGRDMAQKRALGSTETRFFGVPHQKIFETNWKHGRDRLGTHWMHGRDRFGIKWKTRCDQLEIHRKARQDRLGTHWKAGLDRLGTHWKTGRGRLEEELKRLDRIIIKEHQHNKEEIPVIRESLQDTRTV